MQNLGEEGDALRDCGVRGVSECLRGVFQNKCWFAHHANLDDISRFYNEMGGLVRNRDDRIDRPDRAEPTGFEIFDRLADSASVFMTNGPRCTIGARVGRRLHPPMLDLADATRAWAKTGRYG